MKKLTVLLLSAAALLCLFGGCGSSENSLLPPEETEAPVETAVPTEEVLPEKFDGRIETVEINQALSYGVDAAGEFYPIEKLVSKKETAVFARLSESVTPDPEGGTQYLEVARDGEVVGRWGPSELSDSMNLCFNIIGEDIMRLTSGDYTFTVYVDGISTTREATLTDTGRLNVLVVPVTGRFEDRVLTAQGCEDALWHMRSCFPMSSDSWNITLAETLDFTAGNLNLCREDGMFGLWRELSQNAEDYDLVIGFTAGMMGISHSTAGYTQGENTMIISLDADNSAAMVSHIAGHFFGLGDEYEGGAFNLESNCPPSGFTGVSLTDPGTAVTVLAQGIKNARDNGLYCSGCVITPDQVAFDSRSFRLMGYAASFMAGPGEYTNSYWISSDAWNYLFDVFTTEANEPTGAAYERGFGVTVRGGLWADGGFDAERMYAIENTPITPPETSGEAEYSLVFEDADGNVLSRTEHAPDFFILSDPVGEAKYTMFETSVEVPQGASVLRMYGPKLTEDEDGNEVYITDCIWSYEISPSTPSAQVTNISETKEFSGEIWVEWSGHDEDGDSLYYAVSFVCDDGTEIPVYEGEATSCPVDLGQLPYASEARIRIRCTDGFNASVSDSVSFISLG